jgi:hypothetical protein
VGGAVGALRGCVACGRVTRSVAAGAVPIPGAVIAPQPDVPIALDSANRKVVVIPEHHDDDVLEPAPAPARRPRIVWPRVAALAMITLVSGAGAFAALRDVAQRTRPATLDLADGSSAMASGLAVGPRIGDLRGLASAGVPEPVVQPDSSSEAPRGSSSARTRSGSTVRSLSRSRPGGNFVIVSGEHSPSDFGIDASAFAPSRARARPRTRSCGFPICP